MELTSRSPRVVHYGARHRLPSAYGPQCRVFMTSWLRQSSPHSEIQPGVMRYGVLDAGSAGCSQRTSLTSAHTLMVRVNAAPVPAVRSRAPHLHSISRNTERHRPLLTAGTISYMAPELLRQGKFGRAADVYSFAIISASAACRIAMLFCPLRTPACAAITHSHNLVPHAILALTAFSHEHAILLWSQSGFSSTLWQREWLPCGYLARTREPCARWQCGRSSRPSSCTRGSRWARCCTRSRTRGRGRRCRPAARRATRRSWRPAGAATPTTGAAVVTVL